MRAFVSFSRPHTIIGTTLSVIALAILAGVEAATPVRWTHVLAVLVGALAVNVYIVGLNQLTDIAIDRINKPWLPLASGALSVRTGRLLVWGCGALAVVVGLATGPFALLAFVVGIAVGGAYSLPPLRLKRFALWAALAIAGVRGLTVNLLLFAHFLTTLGQPPVFPPLLVALTSIVLALSLVIAWFKDIPDMDGDRRFHIHTLTLRLGPQRVIGIGLAVLSMVYSVVIVAGLVGLPNLHGGLLAVAHLVALTVLVIASRRVDVTQRPSIARFYLLIWGLFYAEYVVFPAAGLMA